MDDDLSTLGGDEFFNSPGTSPMKTAGGAEGLGGEEFDELKEAPEEYEMIVNGFRCPDEYTSVLTPMEFEEMVKMFQEYDVDGSGTIDKVNFLLDYMNISSRFYLIYYLPYCFYIYIIIDILIILYIL